MGQVLLIVRSGVVRQGLARGKDNGAGTTPRGTSPAEAGALNRSSGFNRPVLNVCHDRCG